jgi:UDP-glucose 4-epimerase
MMSLEDSVDLVMFAFENADQEIYLFRTPAATIETLAIALKELFNANNEIKNYWRTTWGKII